MMSNAVESEYVKRNELIFVVFATMLPLFFTITWLLKNSQLPGADAANFLLTSVDIYHHFQNDGFWGGLLSCFANRGWRPIFFPVVAVPFLLLSSGNLLISYSLTAVLSIFLSTLYVYLYFRLELDRLSSIVATNIIGLLPVLQVLALGFYSESMLFPCIMGSVYHLIKSNYLRDIRHSCLFAFLFTLGALLRPIEISMMMVFVLSYFFYYGWYQGIFKVREVLTIIAISVTSLFIFAAKALTIDMQSSHAINLNELSIMRYALYSTAACTMLVWPMVAIANLYPQSWQPKSFFEKESFLIPVVIVILLLALVWFVPFAFETCQWIYQTSFGSVATGTIRLVNFSILGEMIAQIHNEGVMVLAGIILIGMLGKILSFNKKLTNSIISPVVCLFMIVPLPLLEVLTTVQDQPRKLSVAYPAMMMGLLIVGLRRGYGLPLRIGFVIMLLTLQFMLVSIETFSKLRFNAVIGEMVSTFIQPPVMTKPNPHDVLRGFFEVQARENGLKAIAVEVNPNEVEPVDPFLISLMIYVHGDNFWVNYPYFDTFSPQNIQKLTKNFDGVFISDRIDKMTISSLAAEEYYKKFDNEKNPSIKTMYQFLYYFSKRQLEKIGWKVGSCLVIKSACTVKLGQEKADCLGCMLLPINHSDL